MADNDTTKVCYYYGQRYPFEGLPQISLVAQSKKGPSPTTRQLTKDEMDMLQCMYLWVQSALRVYCGDNSVNNHDVPPCITPSYGEVWWILQMYTHAY